MDLSTTKNHATTIMRSCPVPYVSKARTHGSLWEEVRDGSVSCADTGFWVDHEEPIDALRIMGENGVGWTFGDLPEGHEYLVVVK